MLQIQFPDDDDIDVSPTILARVSIRLHAPGRDPAVRGPLVLFTERGEEVLNVIDIVALKG